MDEQKPPADTQEPAAAEQVKKPSRFVHLHRFWSWYVARKRWTIPVSVLLLLIILAIVPWTRYQAAGVVLKKNVNLVVTDSIAHTPVSGVRVSVGGVSAATNGEGEAALNRVPVGNHTAVIEKKYYKKQQLKLLVPIRGQKEVAKVSFVPTGRQVRLVVKDLVSQKLLSDVDIKLAGISAKTDKKGEATVVMPPSDIEGEAKISRKGYNEAKVKVKASTTEIKQNDFALTPAGKVYFLSKLSGQIDVVKTNLDGSGRQTVLEGTGHEDDRDTLMVASKDWKYVALKANRGSGPALYIINSSDDELLTIDQTGRNFTLIGWEGDYFMYKLIREDIAKWRSGREALKSYHAASGNLIVLNQAKATGTDGENYAREIYQLHHQLSGKLVFTKSWEFGKSSSSDPTQQPAGIYDIEPNGQRFSTLKTFNHSASKTLANDGFLSANNFYFTAYMSKPNLLVMRLDDSVSDNDMYFKYTDKQLSEDAGLAAAYNNEYQAAYRYLLSSSGKQSFWAEPRDGKYTLVVGDASGGSSRQVASLSEYQPYGWFSDEYLLVSKSNELYIIPASGIEKDGEAIKISEYHE